MNARLWLRAQWDRITAFLCIAVGGVLIVSGWFGASGAPTSADQVSYLISGGLGGLYFLGVGGILLMSADLHDEWRKLDGIEKAITDDRDRALVDLRGERGSAASANPGELVPIGGSDGRGSDRRILLAAREATTAEPGRTGLVSRRDGIALILPGIGALMLVLGWLEASDGAGSSRHGLSAAVAGLLLTAAGAAGAAFSWRYRCQARKSRLFGGLIRHRDEAQGVEDGQAVPAVDPDRVLIADAIPLYHRSGCPMLRGQTSQSRRRDDIDPTLKSCGICGA